MKSVGFLLCLLVALALAVPVVAQEGYPLSGTWSGDWGTSPKEADRRQTTLVLSWDGKAVQGLVDPGPDSAKIKVATLDTTKWTVHMESDIKDQDGKAVPYTVVHNLEKS